MILYKKGILPDISSKLLYSKKRCLYNDTICSFDIETSSAWLLENGTLINDKDELTDKFYNEKTRPVSLCYIWQLSIAGNIYYGRELKKAIEAFNELNEKTTGCLTIWVHNLAFEIAFLVGYMTLKKQFARSTHHPIYAEFLEFDRLKFRCSYILTRLSLEAWGEKIGVEKKSGDLDYNIIRTPKTKLTKKELTYCEYDCKVIDAGIQKFLEKYKHMEDIPLTQTGEVRKEVQTLFGDNLSYLKRMCKLVPNDFEQYQMFIKAFSGGYTHANFLYVKQILHDLECFDFASSYPYCMIACLYPNTPFTPDIYNEKMIDKFAYILKLRLTNVQAKTFNHYISFSKCEMIKGQTLDNGRVITAEYLEIWVTELDFEIIKKTYTFDFSVLKCYSSVKGYLPRDFILLILEHYKNKTELKGAETDEEVAIYQQSKEFINALYGLMVTSVLYDTIELDLKTGEWYKIKKSVDDVNKQLAKLKNKVTRKNTLAYQWGIYVTAWGRYNLWRCVLGKDKKTNIDKYIVYMDTDSIKKLGHHSFDWYNQEVDEKLKLSAKINNFDFSLTRPLDKKGVVHPIGYFCRESDATEFVTLGAKRYAYRSAKDGEIHTTVSGVPKKMSTALNNNIANFEDGFIFPRSHKYAPKLLTYLYKESYMDGIVWNKGKYDEYVSRESCGINLRRKSYDMSMTEEFSYLIDTLFENNSLSIMLEKKNETEIL